MERGRRSSWEEEPWPLRPGTRARMRTKTRARTAVQTRRRSSSNRTPCPSGCSTTTTPPETKLCADSTTAARAAAACAAHAVDLVATGQHHNAFALVRPPGHHACSSFAEQAGFCLFNNVSVATYQALTRYVGGVGGWERETESVNVFTLKTLNTFTHASKWSLY